MSTRRGKPYEDGITVSFKEDVVKAAQVVYPDSSFVQIARRPVGFSSFAGAGATGFVRGTP